MIWIYKRPQFKELTEQYMLLASECCVIASSNFPLTSKWGQCNKNSFAMPNKSLRQNVNVRHTYNWRVECETVTNICDDLAWNPKLLRINWMSSVILNLMEKHFLVPFFVFGVLICTIFVFEKNHHMCQFCTNYGLKGKQKKK